MKKYCYQLKHVITQVYRVVTIVYIQLTCRLVDIRSVFLIVLLLNYVFWCHSYGWFFCLFIDNFNRIFLVQNLWGSWNWDVVVCFRHRDCFWDVLEILGVLKIHWVLFDAFLDTRNEKWLTLTCSIGTAWSDGGLALWLSEIEYELLLTFLLFIYFVMYLLTCKELL